MYTLTIGSVNELDIKIKVDLINLTDEAKPIQQISLKTNKIKSYLRSNKGFAILARFTPKNLESKHNIVTALNLSSTNLQLYFWHHDDVYCLETNKKNITMDFYNLCVEAFKGMITNPKIFGILLKKIPEMRQSVNTPISFRNCLEQEIIHQAPKKTRFCLYGNTALIDASRYGHTELMKHLLEAGAKPNQPIKLPLNLEKELAFPIPGSNLEQALLNIDDDYSVGRSNTLYTHKGQQRTLAAINRYRPDTQVTLIFSDGFELTTQWVDFDLNDRIQVGNILNITGYAVISYLRFGPSTSYHATRETALACALSNNQAQAVSLLLEHGAIPHAHNPLRPVLGSPLFKGHTEGLEAFFSHYSQYQDVAHLLDQAIDFFRPLSPYSFKDPPLINQLTLLVMARQYKIFGKIIQELKDIKSLKHFINHFPNFTRAAACSPNINRLSKVQKQQTKPCTVPITTSNISLTDIPTPPTITVAHIIQQLKINDYLLINYFCQQDQISDTDRLTLSMVLSIILQKPETIPQASLYFDMCYQVLDIGPQPLKITQEALDYWKQLISTEELDVFLKKHSVITIVQPQKQEYSQATIQKPKASNPLGEDPLDQTQTLKQQWTSQEKTRPLLPEIKLQAETGPSVPFYENPNDFEAFCNQAKPNWTTHYQWTQIQKMLRKYHKKHKHVQAIQETITSNLMSEPIDIATTTRLIEQHKRCYQDLREQNLPEVTLMLERLQSDYQQHQRYQQTKPQSKEALVNGEDVKTIPKPSSKAIQKCETLLKIKNQLSKKLKHPNFFHTVTPPPQTPEEQTLKGFILHISNHATSLEDYPHHDNTTIQAIHKYHIIKWIVSMEQLHYAHKETSLDLHRHLVIDTARNFLVHHSHTLSPINIEQISAAIKQFTERCQEPNIDWRLALLSVYQPIIKIARERFNDRLPQHWQNLTLLKQTLFQPCLTLDQQHNLSCTLNHLCSVLYDFMAYHEHPNIMDFKRWLNQSPEIQKVILVLCFELVEQFKHPALFESTSHTHRLIQSYVATLKHHFRNPLAHEAITIETSQGRTTYHDSINDNSCTLAKHVSLFKQLYQVATTQTPLLELEKKEPVLAQSANKA
ncbi:MAG: ankyrin repeat domain-containing protein [Pseudomonadota bacterium]|nr:ankyrin repeat domain-containing protein [Pseudomonadota bacterium]MEC8461207.1 ankyrin repeat domain-containing protein [Pseudomonadota bacterium]